MNISQKSIVEVIKKALSYLDPRLVSHGERVAFIILKMLQEENRYSDEELRDLVALALMHDIGAYKTEEVDDLLVFEDVRPNDHAIYGYLFIKHFTPLSRFSECILYHHVEDEDADYYDRNFVRLGQMFHFADRLDIVHEFIDGSNLERYLEKNRKRFNEEDIYNFIEVNEKYKVIDKLKDKSYLEELNQFFDRNQYTEEQLISFLIMLAYLIDFKSEFTVTHNILVVTVAVELARHLNLKDDEVNKIRIAAWLHDVGKIATPSTILEKSGVLTAEEMEIMTKHVRYTEEIISNLVDEDIAKIAVRHHEKLDGSGYHYGLTAKDLSLPERILAVADIISALVSRRSYKDAFPKEMVISILTDMANTNKIDKNVVNSFIENYDEIMSNANYIANDIVIEYTRIKEEFMYYSDLFEHSRVKEG